MYTLHHTLLYTTLSHFTCRLRTEFKKGYPHGPASLEVMSDNGTDPLWAGHFTNGVLNGDTMEPNIRK